ncbi:uncharacterized protein LOC130935277 [Arachis stenosperma]|uniref:uncharacterized protein LOC130935277 n=1 Tax=Arachis stenosperma TaxID=217475 RepID=UPI0025AB9C18|nr:uncharacterized protein LOC130935277 [Arachis stenosperma]
MGVFYHEDPPNHHTKRCKIFAATIKEVFSFNCQNSCRKLSIASLDDEEFPAITDLEEEQQVVVMAVRSRQAMEKQKHKPGLYVTQTITTKEKKEGGNEEEHDDQREEFCSVKSCFSCCSSSNAAAVSDEAFCSVKTNLSRCNSSINEAVELFPPPEYWRRSIIRELCHCEGWPFGLCRKAVLLPPLPKSPSESWLSSKIQRSSKDAT